MGDRCPDSSFGALNPKGNNPGGQLLHVKRLYRCQSCIKMIPNLHTMSVIKSIEGNVRTKLVP